MQTNEPTATIRIPKPAGVPSGVAKTTTRDFSGFERCISCGRTTTRAACVEPNGHGGRSFVGHVDPTGECCEGMLVVTANWDNAGHGFPHVMFDNGDGTSSATWAVCPTCCVAEG